jgi:small subunit ribosomal protein S17e
MTPVTLASSIRRIRPSATHLRDIVRVWYLTLLCSCCFSLQGVRTKTVKKSARTIVEKYYTRLTLDFHTNKRIVDDVAILPSKRMRNKIAGYTTHLMRRIAKGPVRGISLKLQEEERERRLDFVPEVSALEQETIQIDPDTRDLLESLGYGNLNGVAVNASAHTRE